jgi:hypothetical protein
MNKTFLYLAIVLTSVIAISCSKKEVAEEPRLSENRLIPIDSETKTQNYLMVHRIGHPAEGCKGCVKIAGVKLHINCMNYGHYCTSVASVTLQQTGTDMTATTTDTFGLTSENFYAMPDRSLDYIDENNNRIFLNIPEQLVWRDTTTLQFTFTGLSFSNTPLYTNN